jgi:hypothetical protein
MARERVVLLRHPCILEEVVKKFGQPESVSAEFESWDFIEDPRYMANPVKTLITNLHESQRFKRLISDTQEINTDHLLIQDLLDTIKVDPDLPPDTIKIIGEHGDTLLGLQE